MQTILDLEKLYEKDGHFSDIVEKIDWKNTLFGKENFIGLDWDESRMDQLYRLPLKTG